MSDDYNITSTNWWDKSRFDVGPGGSSSSSSSGIASFGGLPCLPNDDSKDRSSMESHALEWSQMLLRGDHPKSDVAFLSSDTSATTFHLEPPSYGGPSSSFHVADTQHSMGFYGGHYSPPFTSKPPQLFWAPQNVSSSQQWETSSVVATRPNFFPGFLQPQLTSSSPIEDKTRNTLSTHGVTKRSGNEAPAKRQRAEAASSMPPFKARKEKMGDRITALQQLVSPFGKTDTASVLSEAIEYIKLLHEQVLVLSTPYVKINSPIHGLQSADTEGEGEKNDLRSRGLCLVPVSSTFPVAHETGVDIWTHTTIGGGFR